MYKWKVDVEENTQLSFWKTVKWSSDKFDKFALEKFLTVFFLARSSKENPSERGFFEDLSPRFKVNCCFLSRVLMSTGTRDSPTPSVSNLSLRSCRHLSTVTWGSNRGSVDGFRTGKVAEIGDLWFTLGAKASWSKITDGKQNYRVLPRRNLEATGAVGANLRPFSFVGSVGPLRWSTQPW